MPGPGGNSSEFIPNGGFAVCTSVVLLQAQRNPLLRVCRARRMGFVPSAREVGVHRMDEAFDAITRASGAASHNAPHRDVNTTCRLPRGTEGRAGGWSQREDNSHLSASSDSAGWWGVVGREGHCGGSARPARSDTAFMPQETKRYSAKPEVTFASGVWR